MLKLKTTKSTVSIAVFCTALLSSGSAFSDDDHLKQSSAEWWQWALSIPNDPTADSDSSHPLVGRNTEDHEFEYCGVGQHGDTWFLGGDFSGSGEPVVRTCKIPEGKAILLAVINGECSTAEGDVSPETSVKDKAHDLKDCAGNLIAPVDFAEAALNGKPIEVEPIRTNKAFSVSFPPNNVLGIDPIVNPSLSQANGYFAYIPALKPGNHVLTFSGGIRGVFEINGTYNIEIIPGQEQ